MSKAKVFFTSIALGVSLLVLPGISSANTYYTVNQGDNLWRISKVYGTTVENLKSLNGLSSDTIRSGQKLLVGTSAGGVVQNVQTTATNPNKPVSRSSDRIQEIIAYSYNFIGVPYVSGGMSPSGFDCSGYIKYVFGNFNINMPRTAAEQYQAGQAVSVSEAKPGDLVAFKTGSYISHIGIYLGGDKFISATSSRGIAVASVYDPYWGDHFLGYSRIIPS